MLTPTTFELKFRTEPSIQFKAGQFISIVIPNASASGKDLRRAYSIASTPDWEHLEVCVKIVPGGPGTTYLNKLRPGDSFRAFAPYGDFVFKPKPGKGIFFISTGTGLSPFRSMMQTRHFWENKPARIVCLFGVRDESDLLYTDELPQKPGVEWVACVSRPNAEWKGFRGRVTDWMRARLQANGATPDFPWLEFDYYLCGNGAMIAEAIQFIKERGVQKDSIHQEIYYRPKPGET